MARSYIGRLVLGSTAIGLLIIVGMPVFASRPTPPSSVGPAAQQPAAPPAAVEWRFDQPQPEWKATPLWNPPYGAPVLTRTADALRVTLTTQSLTPSGALRGVIRVDLPDWKWVDWDEVVIRARADSASSLSVLGLGFNEREGRGDAGTAAAPPYQFGGEREQKALVRDGTVRTYRLSINTDATVFTDAWRALFVYVGSTGQPGSIEILSVSIVPKAAVRPPPKAVEWRFDQPQPDWKSAEPVPRLRFSEPQPDSAQPVPGLPLEMARLERTDALRVTLFEGSRLARRSWAGGVYVDLPDWRRHEWGEVVVSARTTSNMSTMSLGLHPEEGVITANANQVTLQATGGLTRIVRDGVVRAYRFHLDWGNQRNGPWRRMGLLFEASGPGSIDIVSVRVVPAAPDGRVTETTLEPPQLKADFALFRRALEEAHQALYRYTTKRDMDAAFARAEAKLTRPMTILQFHNVLAPVRAAVRDGGGGRNFWFSPYQDGGEIGALMTSAKQFPLALTFESSRAFVVLNQGLDERVKPGMEVLTINGLSLAEILRRILPNLGQDGDIRTHQMYRLGIHSGFFRPGTPGKTGFGEAYRLYIGDPRRFRTTLRDPRTRKTVELDLDGVTLTEAAVNVQRNSVNRDVVAGLATLRSLVARNTIRYLDGEDTAVLVPAWGSGSSPESFFKETFAGLKSRGTKNLIVDLRGNTGGFDLSPVLLYSYLTSKEFWVCDCVSRIRTLQPSFRQYTTLGDIDPVTDPYYGSAAGIWKPDPRGGWQMTEKYGRQYGSNFVGLVGVQKPAENHFDGTLYILTDGGSISASTMFTDMADYYRRAIFIGEETGSAAEGGTAGGGLSPTLPESLLQFDIGLETGFRADPRHPRRGTLPTYRVVQTVGDLAKGRDTALEFTRELIQSGKK